MSLAPHEYWQHLHDAADFRHPPAAGVADLYPAALADGRLVALPVRVLPGDGTKAVASLIVNQASFAVVDALADAMAALAAEAAAEVVVGMPTLGLPLAEGVARRLGHSRFVALGTSRKFWYDDALSVPLASITSPSPGKRLYVDPRMLPLLENRRVIVVDDVISTGASLLAVLDLLALAGLRPGAAVFAMLQGSRWRDALQAAGHGWLPVAGALATPRLERSPDGLWRPAPEASLPSAGQ